MARTRITGTLTLPDGTLYNGSMFISWGAIPWMADDGTLIPAGPGITSQVKNGVVDVSLQPTDGTTVPTPIYYYVVFRGTGPATVPQAWSVPTSGSPVPLSSVIIPATSGPPIASGIVTLNGLSTPVQLFARVNDTNVTLAWASVTATHTLTAGWTGQLAPSRGGTGDDTSAVTGVPKIDGGNWRYDATAQDLTSWPAAVSNTEVGYLDGVTSAIQTQLDAKASSSSLSSYLPLAGGTTTGLVTMVPATGNYALDIQKSGAFGTLRLYDQTPTTGVTQEIIRAGAGQNQALTQWQDSGGNLLAGVLGTGVFWRLVAGAVNVQIDSGVDLASTSGVKFYDGTNIFGASADAGVFRNAAGVVEINNGSAGSYRDLIVRNAIGTGTASADGSLANSQFMLILTSNTNLQIRAKGSDGVVRHADITLAP